MTEILYRDEAYKIVGCCMQVHGILGAGFLEEVYQEALEKEFIAAGIPYEREGAGIRRISANACRTIREDSFDSRRFAF